MTPMGSLICSTAVHWSLTPALYLWELGGAPDTQGSHEGCPLEASDLLALGLTFCWARVGGAVDEGLEVLMVTINE